MKYTYITSASLIFLITCIYIYLNRETDRVYEYREATYKGKFKNNLPVGMHESFIKSGKKRSELTYDNLGVRKNEIFYQPHKGYIEQYDYYENGLLSRQDFFYEDGDTMGVNNLRFGYFFDSDTKNKPEKYFDNRIKGHSKALKLDVSLNKVIEYKGPLDFLTKRDTILLDSFYVGWRDQCLEIERTRKEGSIK